MFIVLLKFSENKSQASEYMASHNDWIKKGFNDGIFLLVGSLQPGLGGSVIAHNTSKEALEVLVNADPFVKHNVVSAEIIEIDPKKADERLSFLVS
ncbi:YciI family protein [Thalassotalea sediminis]|uniref:YciI family protein n=1 Tax=Thalassotalea sediminis TaxID=1759089 RepID=UPI0025722B33|nr:YciI family protein [Thalassotalea sediminis]